MDTHTHLPSFDVAAIKERLSMAVVCENEGVKLRKRGDWLIGFCPFHEERTPSFQIGGQRPDRATCRGCGWSGDIVEFWMARREIDFRSALAQLASLAGLTPSVPGVRWSGARLVKEVEAKSEMPPLKPPLPRLRMLRTEEIREVARTRGLSAAAVGIAAMEFRRVGACLWPQREGFHGWEPKASGAWPSWVATDGERRVAEYRRVDNERYPIHRENEAGEWELAPEDQWIKAWSSAGKSWPLGAAEMGDRTCVLLVEGGPDMLAAYHFLWGFRLLDRVAVVCMLGGGNRIAPDALPFFAGKRVRIMEDADGEKAVKGRDGQVKKYIRPGREAAGRWTQDLTRAGALVRTFELYGLQRADGRPVKDVNDLALCNAATVGSDEVMAAFYDWDF